jgi:acetate kinase
MRVLVVNAGSSSLKLSLLDGETLLSSRDLRAERAEVDAGQIAAVLSDLGAVDAVGHRIVHGGARFHAAVVIDAEVLAALTALTALAPLHQAKSLAALAAVNRVHGDVPAVACFDTAFHAALTPAASTYPLPEAWRRRWGLRRYGFHGLAHASVARRVTELTGRPLAPLRLITCHLGAGASLAAIHDGVSVDTTMGFTPLDGLVMATRPGSLDPGLLLWLLENTGLSEVEMAATLEHESGLLALAGTGDMAEVLERAAGGEPRASLALEVYIHRLVGAVAAMAAAMNGLDVLAFSGGVGEHAPTVRRLATEGLRFLGVSIADQLNEHGTGDREIAGPHSAVSTLVIQAREDLEIARQVHGLLAPDRAA